MDEIWLYGLDPFPVPFFVDFVIFRDFHSKELRHISFLCFGDIPDMNSPLYSQVRNRVCVDGREWLSSEMKDAMSHKLLEKNRLYTLQERKIAILYRYLYLALKVPKKVFSLIYR